MEKRIDLSDNWALDSNETRIIQFAYSKQYKAYVPDDRRFTKTAACTEALDFASSISPQPGRRVILVSAVGEFETWGGNKKADAFPRAAIHGEYPKDFDMSILPPEAIARIWDEWGYKTFPTKFDTNGNQIGGGNSFNEHINRYDKFNLNGKPITGSYDPRLDPRTGFILAAFLNEKRRRVELIQTILESRDARMCSMLDEGFLPGISMASDVPWDRCSICGALSLTEDSYCDHLKKENGLRGKILRSFGGKGVYMINDFPDFFDSSTVGIRAATEAGTLTKVAGFSNKTYVMPGLQKKKELQSDRIFEYNFNEKTASLLSTVDPLSLSVYAGIIGIFPTITDYMNIYYPAKTANMEESIYAEGDLLNLIPASLESIPSGYIDRCQENYMFDLDEFSHTLNVLKPYMDYKSYHPAHFYKGMRKTASQNTDILKEVDLSIPFEKLSPSARAAIVTKILTDKLLKTRIKEALADPRVQAELEKKSIRAIYTDSEEHPSIPVYEDLAQRFGKKPNMNIQKFYS